MMRKSQASAFSRLILNQLQTTLIPTTKQLPSPHPHAPTKTTLFSSCISSSGFNRSFSTDRAIHGLLADLEREKNKEREEKKRAGLDTSYIDAEDEEDYLGVGPLIEKLEKEKLKNVSDDLLNMYEEPTDSESEDDERFTPDALRKRDELFEKKFKRHEDLLKNMIEAGIYILLI